MNLNEQTCSTGHVEAIVWSYYDVQSKSLTFSFPSDFQGFNKGMNE